MKMSIRWIAGAAALFVVGTAPSTAQLQMTGQRLHDDLFVISGYKNGNILVLRAGDGLLLVDAQSARRVPEADSVLRTLVGALPVRWIVNTHYHSDHVGGNGFFRARGARVIAHRNVPPEAARDTTVRTRDGRDWHRTPEPAANMPDSLFSDSLRLQLGSHSLTIHHPIDAHTNGDAMIWIPSANVLHAGDIVEINDPPFIDWWTRGSLEGMVRAVDWALARSNNSTRIVPGHGPVIDRAALQRYRQQLVDAGRTCPVAPTAPTAYACRHFD
jgi:glyoxylase-like metal-dependent hydrolase (beta-lactamase superfamily II)